MELRTVTPNIPAFGGINWRQTGRARIKAYRAKRRHKNRIASRSRARNRT